MFKCSFYHNIIIYLIFVVSLYAEFDLWFIFCKVFLMMIFLIIFYHVFVLFDLIHRRRKKTVLLSFLNRILLILVKLSLPLEMYRITKKGRQPITNSQ